MNGMTRPAAKRAPRNDAKLPACADHTTGSATATAASEIATRRSMRAASTPTNGAIMATAVVVALTPCPARSALTPKVPASSCRMPCVEYRLRNAAKPQRKNAMRVVLSFIGAACSSMPTV